MGNTSNYCGWILLHCPCFRGTISAADANITEVRRERLWSHVAYKHDAFTFTTSAEAFAVSKLVDFGGVGGMHALETWKGRKESMGVGAGMHVGS